MIKTGLIAPVSMKLIEFIYPIIILFMVSTFITKNDNTLKTKIPEFVKGGFFIIVTLFHFVYIFLFGCS